MADEVQRDRNRKRKRSQLQVKGMLEGHKTHAFCGSSNCSNSSRKFTRERWLSWLVVIMLLNKLRKAFFLSLARARVSISLTSSPLRRKTRSSPVDKHFTCQVVSHQSSKFGCGVGFRGQTKVHFFHYYYAQPSWQRQQTTKRSPRG